MFGLNELEVKSQSLLEQMLEQSSLDLRELEAKSSVLSGGLNELEMNGLPSVLGLNELEAKSRPLSVGMNGLEMNWEPSLLGLSELDV